MKAEDMAADIVDKALRKAAAEARLKAAVRELVDYLRERELPWYVRLFRRLRRKL